MKESKRYSEPYHQGILVQKKDSSIPEKLSLADFEHYFNIIYSDHLVFENIYDLRKTIDHCPWNLRESSVGEENRRLAKKYSTELCNGFITDVSIKWIDSTLEYGLFANQKIPFGSYVGEFTGFVRKIRPLHPKLNPYCFHYPTKLLSWNYRVIDAQHFGNETRFINHSENANLQPYCLCDRGLLHIVFFAKETIPQNSQLTYNYGKDFWKQRQKVRIEKFTKKAIIR